MDVVQNAHNDAEAHAPSVAGPGNERIYRTATRRFALIYKTSKIRGPFAQRHRHAPGASLGVSVRVSAKMGTAKQD